MRLNEISDFSDTSNIHIDRPKSKYPHIHGGESGMVDEMSEELEHIIDRWIKVDWKDPKLNPESKARFSNAITELLDIIQGENI
jgi:hypothetical protein